MHGNITSCTNTVLGFEPTTLKTYVSSHNHKTKAPSRHLVLVPHSLLLPQLTIFSTLLKYSCAEKAPYLGSHGIRL